MTTGGTNVGEIRARITLEMAEFRRQMDEARRRIQDLERDTRRGADGFRDMGSAITGLGAGVALGKLIREMQSAVAEANKLYNAFQGLSAVAKGFGVQTGDAQKAAEALANRGFLTLTQSVLAYKTALSTGLGLDESTKLINALADSAAYNRQSFYDMGGAVQASLDGIKNGNSVLSDAVGVTKNLSVMQKEYAASIGTTAGRLTDAQKIQAAYSGFLRETAIFAGNADEAMQGFTGSQNRFTQATNTATVALGEAFMPVVQQTLETLTPTILALADFVDNNKALVAGLATGTAGILAFVAALAIIPPALALIKGGIVALGASAGPIGLAIVAIGALAGGIGALIAKRGNDAKATEEMRKKQAELNDVLNKAPIDRTVADTETLRSKTEELTGALAERADMQARLNEIEAFQSRGEGTPQLLSEAFEINDALTEMDGKLRGMGYDGVEQATGKLAEMKGALKYSVDALTDQDKAEAQALATKKATLKEMSALAAQFKTLSSAQTLDASQKGRLVDITEKLIEQYPELNAFQGEDGRIRADNIDVIIAQIDTDKKYTEAAAEQVTARIRNFAKENEAQAKSVQAQIDNYTRLIQAMVAVSGAKAGTFAEDAAAQAEASRRRASGNVGDIVNNGALTMLVSSGATAELEKQRDAALKQQQKYADTVREMEKLASQVETGTQTFTKDIIPQDAAKGKTGKTPAELAAGARKAAYDADLKAVQFQADFYDMTADAQIAKYDALKKRHTTFLKESVDDANTLALQLKRLSEDSAQSRYDVSATWIDAEEKRMEDAGKSELDIAKMKLAGWTRLRDRYAKDSEQYLAADNQRRQSAKDAASATINAEKALLESRKKLAEETADVAEALVKRQKSAIKDAKDADLDAIEKRKKAALDDYDSRIDAIQRLRDANKTLNADADYATELAEKQARLGELASAVGPAGIAERDALLKEIAQMQTEHDRELTDRTLEAQQQALSDEKDAQETAYDNELSAKEAHYDTLLSAFDSYSNDVKAVESGIAAFRVAESSNANSAILTNLDTFLTQYRAKMAAVNAAQKDADLSEYNANKSAWTAAKSSGNTAEMARLTARNDELRKLYGVNSDTGALQAFKDGGVVQGAYGSAVPVIAHAGEIVLNAQQQAALWSMIAAPRAAAQAPAPVTQIINNVDMGAENVTLTDRADAGMYFDEKARAFSRIASTGVKTL